MSVGVRNVFLGNGVRVTLLASPTLLRWLRLLNIRIVTQFFNISWLGSAIILLDVSYRFEMHCFLMLHTFRQVFRRLGLGFALHYIFTDLLGFFELLINPWNDLRQTGNFIFSVMFRFRLFGVDWNFTVIVPFISTVLYLFLSVLFLWFISLWRRMWWFISWRLNSLASWDINWYFFLGLTLLGIDLANWTFGKDFLTLQHILWCCGFILFCFYFFSLHGRIVFELLLASVSQAQTYNKDNDSYSKDSPTDDDVKYIIIGRLCGCSGRCEAICRKRVSKHRISTNLRSLL